MQFVRKMHPRFPDAELGNTADGDKERRQVLSRTKSVQANLTSMIQGERGTEHVSARMRISPRRFSSYNTVQYTQLVFLTSDRNGRKTRDGTTQPARLVAKKKKKKKGYATTPVIYCWASWETFSGRTGCTKCTVGNIQGDGRKFLAHLKRHFGSQISESLWVISSEWSQYLQQMLLRLQSVNEWMIDSFTDVSTQEACYSETRSRSNVWKEHTHTERQVWYLR